MLRSWKVGSRSRLQVTKNRAASHEHPPTLKLQRAGRATSYGFLLFEVMVTVAILSLGLTLMLRSFTTSLSAARTSQNYMLACLLVEEKMWELEEEAESTKKITTEPSMGEFSASNEKDRWRENFGWEIACEDLLDEEGQESSLDKVTVAVAWREGGRKREVHLSTYLVNEEE